MDRASPRQRLESFLKTLPSAPEINQEEQGLIWSRTPGAKVDLPLFTKKIQGSAQRAAIRQEIKQLLRENDIQISRDIKKALPSRLSPGNAARLCELISTSAMPLQLQNVASLKPHLQYEIGKLMETACEGKATHLTDFLIKNNGAVQKSMIALIQPALSEHAENIASEAYQAFASALMFGRTINEAMDRAYQQSSARFLMIKPSKELLEVATCIAASLDVEIAVKGRDEKAQQNLESFVFKQKKSIMPALMLATFIPALITSLDQRQKGFHLAIDEFCTVRGAAKPFDEFAYEQRPKVEIDISEMWTMKPSAIADRLAGDIYSTFV